MEDNTNTLKQLGLKVTSPRLKILQFFGQYPDKHFTADELYESLKQNNEDIGIATVYRVLAQFETVGLLNKHFFEPGKAVFELAEEEHHDHMVDVDTGRVIEFVDEDIEALQHKIAHKHGFELVDHALVLYVKSK